MENCKLKTVGSLAEVIKVASKEIQGLYEEKNSKISDSRPSVTDEENKYHSYRSSKVNV